MSEEVFFTADTHFGHKRILELGHGRPFSTVEDMNEALIDNWNARVQPTDRIYHLGDWAFLRRTQIADIITRLNGHIHVIRGNHDSPVTPLAPMFESFQSYKEIKVGEQRLVLFHFPIESWHKVAKGAWHLHGHCHNNFPDDGLKARCDVGVDAWDFAPVHFDEISEKLSGRMWYPPDHHQPDQDT